MTDTMIQALFELVPEYKRPHAIAVGGMMSELADHFGMSREDAIVLGLLHNIGCYECTGYTYHAQFGGNILRDKKYEYWREVYFHGDPAMLRFSSASTLLNFADMHVNSSGSVVNMSDKLNEISCTQGKLSNEYLSAVVMCKMLSEKEEKGLEKYKGGMIDVC